MSKENLNKPAIRGMIESLHFFQALSIVICLALSISRISKHGSVVKNWEDYLQKSNLTKRDTISFRSSF